MSWVTDLAGALGIPGGATIVAVSMSSAFNAAEKLARPERLKEVARLLKLTSSARSAEPVNAVLHIFNLIFGEQHFSSRCAKRSFLATLTVTFAANLVVYLEVYERRPDWTIHREIAIILFHPLFYTVFGWLPDYAALFKTRLLLQIVRHSHRIAIMGIVLVADILLSAALSILLVNIPEILNKVLDGTLELNIWDMWYSSASLIVHHPSPPDVPLAFIVLVSTLATSLWLAMVLLSTALLRVMAPINRFTIWFFDVDQHPLRAIGLISAVLLMIGGFVWGLIRAIVSRANA